MINYKRVWNARLVISAAVYAVVVAYSLIQVSLHPQWVLTFNAFSIIFLFLATGSNIFYLVPVYVQIEQEAITLCYFPYQKIRVNYTDHIETIHLKREYEGSSEGQNLTAFMNKNNNILLFQNEWLRKILTVYFHQSHLSVPTQQPIEYSRYKRLTSLRGVVLSYLILGAFTCSLLRLWFEAQEMHRVVGNMVLGSMSFVVALVTALIVYSKYCDTLRFKALYTTDIRFLACFYGYGMDKAMRYTCLQLMPTVTFETYRCIPEAFSRNIRSYLLNSDDITVLEQTVLLLSRVKLYKFTVEVNAMLKRLKWKHPSPHLEMAAHRYLKECATHQHNTSNEG